MMVLCINLQEIPDDDREQFNQKQIIVSGKCANPLAWKKPER